MTAFDEATAVTAAADGSYTAVGDPDWSAPNGPNGGYLAAIILRAMTAALDDPSRPARSITLHYLRPPQPAQVRIDVVVERSGRTLSTLTARLSQGDRLCVDRGRRLRRRVPADARAELAAADAAGSPGPRRRAVSRARRPSADRPPARAARRDRRAAVQRRGRGAHGRLDVAARAAAGRCAAARALRRRLAAGGVHRADGAGVRADGRPDDPLPQPRGRRRGRA